VRVYSHLKVDFHHTPGVATERVQHKKGALKFHMAFQKVCRSTMTVNLVVVGKFGYVD